MQRRQFLGATCSLAGLAITGCLGADGSNETEERADDDVGTDDLDDETVKLAEGMATAIDEELSLVEWQFHGSLYIPEFTNGEGPKDDIPILAAAYADIVEEGFEYQTMPTALDDEGLIDYMFYIQPEWAGEFVGGELSEVEYHDRIEESIH